MVTDILARHTTLLVAGPEQLAERAFGKPVVDGAIDLPGVMSRKKQVAPVLLAAAATAAAETSRMCGSGGRRHPSTRPPRRRRGAPRQTAS